MLSYAWGDYGVGGGAELYDHDGDLGTDMDAATDKVNVAHLRHNAELVASLSQQLHDHFDGDRE